MSSKRVGVKNKVEDINSDDDGWNAEERRESRFNRIRARVPTGHPDLAKKLLAARKLSASTSSSHEEILDDDDEGDDDLSSDQAVESTTPATENTSPSPKKHHHHHRHHHHHHHRHHHSSTRASVAEEESKVLERVTKPYTSLEKSSRPEPSRGESTRHRNSTAESRAEKLTKHKKSSCSSSNRKMTQFDEKAVVARDPASDSDDNSWDERHQERFSRIRARVPTGHPGLAKKAAQVREIVEA